MSEHNQLHLPADRLFSPDPRENALAGYLYQFVKDLPLICPHGHVDPRLFAGADTGFGSPLDVFVLSDHLTLRRLHAAGVRLEEVGVGKAGEQDPQRAWQVFADHIDCLRGTPGEMWTNAQLHDLFGVELKLGPETAAEIYKQVAARLAGPDFQPRQVYERFHIQALATTDSATDPLASHQAVRDSGWQGRILPSFRPDALLDILSPNWYLQIQTLSQMSGVEVDSLPTFVRALENRRAFFKQMGATATDHAVIEPYTVSLSPDEAEDIFQRALIGEADPADAAQLMGHMLIEMARMSVEDGLVMQIHAGLLRDYDPPFLVQYGPHRGGEFPLAVEFTRNLQPLLNRFGSDPRLHLVLFSANELAWSELAGLAGFYPAVKLGSPWYLLETPALIKRYFDISVEIAGAAGLGGYTDDAHSLLSIPAHHDLWRRVCCDWTASRVLRGLMDLEAAEMLVKDLAYRFVQEIYSL